MARCSKLEASKFRRNGLPTIIRRPAGGAIGVLALTKDQHLCSFVLSVNVLAFHNIPITVLSSRGVVTGAGNVIGCL